MGDWENVSLAYTDYTGDTRHRNHPGAQSEPSVTYTNQTGRNDFRILKVAHDVEHLYFYVETVDALTPAEGDNWMRLYLDTDRNASTGWHGYDYRIVEGTSLQKYIEGHWQREASVTCLVEKNRLMLTLPSALLKNLSHPLDFEFKWSDNMQSDDPLDWYINGDTAPGGRFNFIYQE
jgi:hypothetical protein